MWGTEDVNNPRLPLLGQIQLSGEASRGYDP